MICSTAFVTLGTAQARALGFPALPIAVMPHPFGNRNRQEVKQIAGQCVDDIVKLVSEAQPR